MDWAKDKVHIKNNMGGLTAVYDAIDAGMKELKEVQTRLRAYKQEEVMPIQIVITDGADNASRMTFHDIAAQLKAHDKWSNYHFYLVAVGVDMDTASYMRKLCKPKHWYVKRGGMGACLAG